MEGPQFLEGKYKLNADPAVEKAARHTKRLTGKAVPQNPNARIENYLDRLEDIFNPPVLEEHPEFDRAQRNLGMLKPAILERFTTKFEDIPESYWKGQERLLRERGQQGDYDRFSEEQKNKWKKELSQGLLEDQRASLEQWVDYLASPDLKEVPSYVKYWVFRSVIGLSEYDKEKKSFPERSKGTVKMFPDVNAEALGYVMDALLKRHRELPISFDMFDAYLDPAKKDELIADFRKSLDRENFAMLYAWANEQIRPIPEREMPITDGKWVKYKQGSDHMPLVASIRGRGTGWCTAGESFAKNQLVGGDFYVFYSNNEEANAVNPRIAIRMKQGEIAEVRGIASRQNLDPYIGEVLEAKLKEFPDKDKYLKKERDMRRLTEIDNKSQKGEELSGEDLRFLYEVDLKIEGFGQSADPRINQLIKSRNIESDMLIIFDCDSSQIAHNASEINEHTKLYNGKLEPGIFNLLQKYNIEHVYTSFPNGKIGFYPVKIGERSLHQLRRDLNKNGIMLDESTKQLIKNGLNFTTGGTQNNKIVVLTVGDMGFPDPAQYDQEVESSSWIHDPTTDQVYARARELGLELCIPEAVPNFVSKYWKEFSWVAFGMEPIVDSHGNPKTFILEGVSFYDQYDMNGTRMERRRSESFAFMLSNIG